MCAGEHPRHCKWPTGSTSGNIPPDGVAGTVSSDGQPQHHFSPRQILWLLLDGRTTTQQNQTAVPEQAYVARLRERAPTIQQAQGMLAPFYYKLLHVG
ncbi:MAG TPA: hypothetical protein VF510_15800 [Ktedonobacterales bacterium]